MKTKTSNLTIEVYSYPCTSYLILELVKGELPKVYNSVQLQEDANHTVITTLAAFIVEECLISDIESLESYYLKLAQMAEDTDLGLNPDFTRTVKVILDSVNCVPSYTSPEDWFKGMDIGEIVLNMVSDVSLDNLVAEELAEAKDLGMWLDTESVHQWLLTQSRNRLRVMNSKVRDRLERLVLGEPTNWNITLDSYQRNNLLLLLNICGFPVSSGVEPFNIANTGDWIGEVARMLSKKPDGVLEDTARTNISRSDFMRHIAAWKESK